MNIGLKHKPKKVLRQQIKFLYSSEFLRTIREPITMIQLEQQFNRFVCYVPTRLQGM